MTFHVISNILNIEQISAGIGIKAVVIRSLSAQFQASMRKIAPDKSHASEYDYVLCHSFAHGTTDRFPA